MSKPALIVSQSGRLTPGVTTLVAAEGYEPVSTLVTERAENGQYYLSSATVARIEQRLAEAHQPPVVVVDGEPHIGQLVDLQARLQSTTVVDRRRVVWERLADENPVAATRISLQAARLARRHAANDQRDAASAGPSGTSGRVADCDERTQTHRDRLEQQQATARRRVRTGHTAVDAVVVLLGTVDAPTTPLWNELTGHEATVEGGRPARPATAQTTVGPHTVAVIDTPGIPASDGLPEWLETVLPGLVTALERSTCLLGVGEDHEALVESIAQRFEVPYRSLERPAATAARTELEDLLPSVPCAVRLPYGDDTQALVSALHDRAVVHATEYDDAIYLRLEVSRAATEEIGRRVTAVDGELKRLDTHDSDDETNTRARDRGE
ncbi:hypothetical protein [Halohasta salina]|uniref:hypothetical protein n=1 Tax=Halohasta salina TaxID=2961621 RepID=UPI0020A35FE3|nr:hypothetical protein [Halohasta salina]